MRNGEVEMERKERQEREGLAPLTQIGGSVIEGVFGPDIRLCMRTAHVTVGLYARNGSRSHVSSAVSTSEAGYNAVPFTAVKDALQ